MHAVLHGFHNGAGETSHEHERGKILVKIRQTTVKWKFSRNRRFVKLDKQTQLSPQEGDMNQMKE